MLSLTNLTVGHSNSPLINTINISFSRIDRKRIALLGANGSGKTTLLQTLLQRVEPINGTISMHKERIIMVEQVPILAKDMLVGEYLESLLENEWEWYKVEQVLLDVGFESNKQLQLMSSLSGGERMRIQFAVCLLDDPTIILLDEPTNHLDIEGIEWIMSFMKQYDGSIIYTSHNREFLINTATHIWYIDPHTHDLYTFTGNYYAFLKDKEHRYSVILNTINKLDKEIDEYILWLKQYEFHAKYRFTDRVITRKKKLDDLQKKRESMTLLVIYSIQFPIKDVQTKNKSLTMDIQIKNISYNNDKTIAYNLSKKVYYGDRISIQGANGSGKTTLLKAILNDSSVHIDGYINVSNTAQIGYLGQHNSYVNGIKVMDYIASKTLLYTTEVYSAMHKIGLKHVVDQRMESLSGGQQRRIELLLIALQRPQILLLDEPTNHIDIDTQEEIIQYLQRFTGTIIAISHDTMFLKDININDTIEL